MYNIHVKNDEISIESVGKGGTLLLEAVAIVTALYESLAKRDKTLGEVFQGICESGAPYKRLADIEKDKDDFSEKDQKREDKTKELVDYIFNRSEDDDES